MAPTPTTGAFAWATNGSVTPPLPAGVAAGDVLLVFAMVRNTTQTFTTPAGYSIVAALVQVTNICAIVFGKTAGGSEVAPLVLSSQLTTQPTGAIVVRCTQADLAGTTSATANSSGSAISFPTVATGGTDVLVLRVVNCADDNSVTFGASATLLASEVTILGSDAAMHLWHETQAASPVPTDTATLNAADAWISWTVAVPSAAADYRDGDFAAGPGEDRWTATDSDDAWDAALVSSGRSARSGTDRWHARQPTGGWT